MLCEMTKHRNGTQGPKLEGTEELLLVLWPEAKVSSLCQGLESDSAQPPVCWPRFRCASHSEAAAGILGLGHENTVLAQLSCHGTVTCSGFH